MFNKLKSMNTEITSKSYLSFILEKITSLQDLLNDWKIYTNRAIIVSSSKYIEGKGDRDRDRQKNTNITQYLSSKQELAK